MIGKGEPTVSEYEEAINEVLKVFSQDWLDREVRKILETGSAVGPATLHPRTNQHLECHPVAHLLALADHGRQVVAELYRLGRDLRATRLLPGIQALRNALRKFDQYLGRLFELELFSALTRSQIGIVRVCPDTPDVIAEIESYQLWIEAQHRSADAGRATAVAIHPPVDWVGNGHFKVTIARGTDPIGMARRINRRLRDEYRKSGGLPFLARGENFTIEFMAANDRSMTKVFDSPVMGREGTVRRHVSNALTEKADKLHSAGLPASAKGIIAIDCRSILPVVHLSQQSFYAPMAIKYQGLHDAVFEETNNFLASRPRITAVLLWLQSEVNDGEEINPDWRHRSIAPPKVAVLTRHRLAGIATDEPGLFRTILEAVRS